VVTEESGPAAVHDRASRRRTVAGLVSVGVHGVLLFAVAVTSVTGIRVAREAPAVELTPIQVVAPPPPEPPAPQLQPVTPPSPGTLGRRGREPPRSVTRAPADPYADLIMHYEAPPAADPGNRDGEAGIGLGSGLLGDGIGGAAFGVGNVPPPPASRARPPRAKEDYSRWDFHAAHMFAGAIVRLELTVDPRGGVRAVRILKGVDDQIDQRAIELAGRFQFFPALDDDGRSTWGRHGWEFVIR
jgi:TonB family protein